LAVSGFLLDAVRAARLREFLLGDRVDDCENAVEIIVAGELDRDLAALTIHGDCDPGVEVLAEI
jgi:hypothetical protein